MSAQVTRLKKYGKKAQTLRDVDRVFLDSSSPERETFNKRKIALKQTSGNARLSPLKANAALSQDNFSHHDGLDIERLNPSPGSGSDRLSKDQDIVDELSLGVSKIDLGSRRSEKHPEATLQLAKQKPEIRSVPADIDPETKAYIEPLLQCKNIRKTVEKFQTWMDHREDSIILSKIGEGTFGEVYRATGAETVILKLVPLNAKRGKGARSFTSISDAKNEVQLLSRMSKVPGFVEFRGSCVLQGTMPSQLVKQWDDYVKSGRTVGSRNPHKKDSYLANQLWLLIEMSDAGQSLEPGRYMPPDSPLAGTASARTEYLPVRYTWDIFWQIAKALAKGELFASYEHRDLHRGNICVKDCKPKYLSPSGPGSHAFGIGRTGVEVTLIDYSLSRASVSRDETLCYDFKNDKALLRGHGDLQYDMYRYMAEILGDRKSQEFVPETNVLWLWYILKLLLDVSIAPESSDQEVEHKESAECDDRIDLLVHLQELERTLRPENRPEWLWRSADSLLEMGVHKGWFTPTEVIDS